MINKLNALWWRFIKSPQEYAKHIGVKMGQGCFISTRNFSTEASMIEIGNHVRVAAGTSFYTHGGIWTLRKIYNDPTLDYFGKIKIGDYTYIGEDCKIIAGVTIGKNCIIGAGTIVSKSVPDGCMVGGNPCKFLGYTEDYYKKIKQISVETGSMDAQTKSKHLESLSDSAFITKKSIKLPTKE